MYFNHIFFIFRKFDDSDADVSIGFSSSDVDYLNLGQTAHDVGLQQNINLEKDVMFASSCDKGNPLDGNPFDGDFANPNSDHFVQLSTQSNVLAGGM